MGEGLQEADGRGSSKKEAAEGCGKERDMVRSLLQAQSRRPSSTERDCGRRNWRMSTTLVATPTPIRLASRVSSPNRHYISKQASLPAPNHFGLFRGDLVPAMILASNVSAHCCYHHPRTQPHGNNASVGYAGIREEVENRGSSGGASRSPGS